MVRSCRCGDSRVDPWKSRSRSTLAAVLDAAGRVAENGGTVQQRPCWSSRRAVCTGRRRTMDSDRNGLMQGASVVVLGGGTTLCSTLDLVVCGALAEPGND